MSQRIDGRSASREQLSAEKAAKVLHVRPNTLRAWGKKNLSVRTYQRDGHVAVEIGVTDVTNPVTSAKSDEPSVPKVLAGITYYPPGLTRWR